MPSAASPVSAFANAEGGQIVYGMAEMDHEPAGLDSGVDPKQYPEIWFEQVLQQHITPNVKGLTIRHIQLANKKVAVVITIPATNGDPHQASDAKYYRRHSYNRLPMEHYEVREMFRRTTNPNLVVTFHFDKMSNQHDLAFRSSAIEHVRAGLSPLVANSSNEPALYAIVQIAIDARLDVQAPDYEKVGTNIVFDQPMLIFQLRFNPAKTMPVYKEKPTMLPAIGLVVSELRLFMTEPYSIGYEITAPGCHRMESGQLFVEDGKRLRLQFPKVS